MQLRRVDCRRRMDLPETSGIDSLNVYEVQIPKYSRNKRRCNGAYSSIDACTTLYGRRRTDDVDMTSSITAL